MAKTTSLTPVLEAQGAEFTVVNGWERTEFFKPPPDFRVTHGFDFDEIFEVGVTRLPSFKMAWVFVRSTASTGSSRLHSPMCSGAANLATGILIGGLEVITQMILYFFHERPWSRF